MNFIEFKHQQNKKIISLNEGGAAGHCSHIFDDGSMTFKELKEMLLDIFSGKVELTEKVDGANISITWKNGEIGLARGSKTVKEPMNLNAAADWAVAENPTARKGMYNAVKSLNSAFKKLPEKTLENWFNNGKNFMSAEVITSDNKNTIDYGDVYIIMPHNITEYDENGKKVKEDPSKAKEIYDTLKSMDALESEGFTIKSPQVLIINDSIKAQSILEDTIKQIDNFEAKHDLSDNNTIQDYVNKCWTKYIDTVFPDLDKDLKEVLIKRWAKQDKSINSAKIKKMLGTQANIEKFNEIEKSAPTLFATMFEPLEIICLKAAALFLKTLGGFISTNPDETISKMSKEVSNIIDDVLSNPKKYPETLGRQIKKLQKIGLENIAPEEGVVFAYKNKIFKLTGAFAPLNRILNDFKFKLS